MATSICPKCKATEGVLFDHLGNLLSCQQCKQQEDRRREQDRRFELERKREEEARKEAQSRSVRERVSTGASVGGMLAAVFADVTNLMRDVHKEIGAPLNETLSDVMDALRHDPNDGTSSEDEVEMDERIAQTVVLLGTQPTNENLLRQLATQLASKGDMLRINKRPVAALRAYRDYLSRFEQSPDGVIRQGTAQVMHRQVEVLYSLTKDRLVLERSREMLSRFESDDHTNIQHQVAHVLSFRGLSLQRLDRKREAISTYTKLTDRFNNWNLKCVREVVENAVRQKSTLLNLLSQNA